MAWCTNICCGISGLIKGWIKVGRYNRSVLWSLPQLTSVQFNLSVVSDSAIPWTAARQASLSITNSRSLLKFMSIESVMPSSHFILCCPLLLSLSIFPSIRVFSNESVLRISGQCIGVSASASVLPMNIQDWFPLGWTGWISLQSFAITQLCYCSVKAVPDNA